MSLRAKRYLPASLAVWLACSPVIGEARTYSFDATMLGNVDDNIDMALFNQGGQLPGVYQVDILLNGDLVDTGDVVFQLQKDAQGKPSLQPCLSLEQLTRYGVKIADYPGVMPENNQHGKGTCVNLSAIPQANTEFRFYEQKLLLSIPQVALLPKLTGIAPRVLWNDGITAALMNYQLSTNRIEYQGKSTDAQYAQLQPGLNVGAWRLRNSSSWQKQGQRPGRWQSAYTYAERGLYGINSRLTLGERYTPGDIFDGVAFRGVMLGSDEAMLPYSQRSFAPVVRGIARTQARVEVKQNGYTIYNGTVAPGPFALTDLSPVGSGGELNVKVWETDGSPQVFTVPFQTPAIALREGTLRYNLMAGQYRSADRAAIGQATLMYGLPWGLTAYGGVQGSAHFQALSLGLGASLGNWGSISLDSTWAHGQRKGLEAESGASWRVRYSKMLEATNTNFSLASTQYASAGYNTLSEVLNSYDGSVTDIGWQTRSDIGRSKMRSSLSLSQSLGKWGSLNLSGSRQRYWHREGSSDAFGLGYSTGIGSGSLSLNWSQNSQRGAWGQQRTEQIISAMVSMPLDHWLGGNTRASYQVNSSRSGESHELGLNGQAFERQLSWDFRQRYRAGVDSSNRNGSALQLGWSGGYGQFRGSYSYTPSMRQMGAEVAGGVVVHRNGVTFGQPLGDTVALVAAPGAAGVDVGGWAGNKTDYRGYTTRSGISPYQENTVSLNPASLPADAEITQTDVKVVPTQGAVVAATFATRLGARGLMTLNFPDGKPVAFGAVVKLDGQNTMAGVVGERGEAYLTGLMEQGRLSVNWGPEPHQQCHASYQLPQEKGPAGVYVLRATCR
ncbi:TPA: fimbria/pilus outer membrane usher protein [Serratia odorifera]|nr:fimbria/pilus outer membrane usher protein [Serratia odorifera]